MKSILSYLRYQLYVWTWYIGRNPHRTPKCA